MKVEQAMKLEIDHFRKEKVMEKKNKEIRAAPCSNSKCKDKVCQDPGHCKAWQEYRKKYLNVR